MDDIWNKYFAVESEIHFDKEQSDLEAFLGAWQHQGFYEDGLFTLQYRDFESDDAFNSAYNSAINSATSFNKPADYPLTLDLWSKIRKWQLKR